ncbi:MAG: hypothetical protein QOD10_4597 [Mycobacterium sp.]|nr:hypothetical protein [Mycobacterium sp.]
MRSASGGCLAALRWLSICCVHVGEPWRAFVNETLETEAHRRDKADGPPAWFPPSSRRSPTTSSSGPVYRHPHPRASSSR